MTSPSFDGWSSRGRRRCRRWRPAATQLTQLISNTSTATGAIARQSQALEQALTLLPGTLQRSTTTFAGLRHDAERARSARQRLQAGRRGSCRSSWRRCVNVISKSTLPTVGAARRPDLATRRGGGDLTRCCRPRPSLARIAATAFPEMIKQFNAVARPQLDYLRDYTPDVVGGADQPRSGRRLLRRQRALRADAAGRCSRSRSTAPTSSPRSSRRSATHGLTARDHALPGQRRASRRPDGSAPLVGARLQHQHGAAGP